MRKGPFAGPKAGVDGPTSEKRVDCRVLLLVETCVWDDAEGAFGGSLSRSFGCGFRRFIWGRRPYIHGRMRRAPFTSPISLQQVQRT